MQGGVAAQRDSPDFALSGLRERPTRALCLTPSSSSISTGRSPQLSLVPHHRQCRRAGIWLPRDRTRRDRAATPLGPARNPAPPRYTPVEVARDRASHAHAQARAGSMRFPCFPACRRCCTRCARPGLTLSLVSSDNEDNARRQLGRAPRSSVLRMRRIALRQGREIQGRRSQCSRDGRSNHRDRR